MFRFRALTGLLAIFAVLSHVSLLARQNTMMLHAELGQYAVEAALGVICHTDGTETGDQADSSSPSKGQIDCQICVGMACASAVMPSPQPLGDIRQPTRLAARIQTVSEAIASRLAGLRPPSRASPANA